MRSLGPPFKDHGSEKSRLFKKASQKFKNCDDMVISNLLTRDETDMEPQRKSDNKQWSGKTQKLPVIAKRQKSTKKVLYTSVFKSSGPVVEIPSKEGTSTTGNFYKNTVLNKIKNAIKKETTSCRFKGHLSASWQCSIL